MTQLTQKLSSIIDKQNVLAREAMLDIQRAKGSKEIDERTANILLATQMIVMQASISNFQILKEVKEDS